MRLENKVVVVTGAGSGLGKAVSLKVASQGADLVLADINGEAIARTAAEVEAMGRKALQCVVDVCNGESVNQMIADAVAAYGQIHGLVNSAGIFSSIPFLDLTERDWDRMININLKGSFLCAQSFIRQAVEQKTGASIVFLSSISGFIGFTKSAHYCASKGAVRQLSKAIALEFGPNGIRSNVVAPGTIETPMNAWIIDDPEMHKQSVASIPMGRIGKSEEIADAIAFLLSDEASYCTGSELLVDGGQITHC